MLVTELIARFRKCVFDTQPPFFWAESEIILLIDQAEKMFTRLTGGITQDYTLSYNIADEFVALNNRILTIRKAVDIANPKREIEILNLEESIDETRSGEVQALIIGTNVRQARLYPLPARAGGIKISTYRMQADPITSTASALEIEEQHHYYLLHWMKYLAYLEHDSETHNTKYAFDEKRLFEAYCASAKAEFEQLRHKVRVSKYKDAGGNSNTFWETY